MLNVINKLSDFLKWTQYTYFKTVTDSLYIF